MGRLWGACGSSAPARARLVQIAVRRLLFIGKWLIALKSKSSGQCRTILLSLQKIFWQKDAGLSSWISLSQWCENLFRG